MGTAVRNVEVAYNRMYCLQVDGPVTGGLISGRREGGLRYTQIFFKCPPQGLNTVLSSAYNHSPKNLITVRKINYVMFIIMNIKL